MFLSRGFAFAASDYSAQGWAVKEAIEDTEALRRYFAAKYGVPSETYITGHSMGGHITMAVIERYPEAYQGAMPMCGPLGPAIEFLNGVFDMLVTFEALFPGTIGSPYEPNAETAQKVTAALASDPSRAAIYAQHYGRTVEQLPVALSLFHAVIAELKQRAGGEPFDNRNRIYVGFGDNARFNRSVRRYTASPSARDYIRQYATPTGRIAIRCSLFTPPPTGLFWAATSAPTTFQQRWPERPTGSWHVSSKRTATVISRLNRPATPLRLCSRGPGQERGRPRVSRGRWTPACASDLSEMTAFRWVSLNVERRERAAFLRK